MPLPALLPVADIQERLQAIFPPGTENRNYVTREMAAKTIFVMLYVGAVHGSGCWLRPDQVTRMTNAQASATAPRRRIAWREESMARTRQKPSNRWYQDNTRESIRDETLRLGLIRFGAVQEREGLATTSAKPRYALATSFASLFDPTLTMEELQDVITSWREANLSPAVLLRTELVRQGLARDEKRILVRFPNGETRRMEPGPSSIISKAVVEEFAPRFLKRPGVIWLSESRHKVVQRDDQLANLIGLEIKPDQHLPDLILVDLHKNEPLLVFVEVVATDGPINEARREALMAVVAGKAFTEEQVAFVTAFEDRNHHAFRRSVSVLSWRSFAWFRSEPDHIIILRQGTDVTSVMLSDLIGQ